MKKTLILFDIDGTLSPAREKAPESIKEMLRKLRALDHVTVGCVGGSDLVKQKEQLGENALDMFDYNFPENGIVAYKEGERFHANSVVEYLGEEKYSKLISFMMRYMADLELPMKRGTFVELRTGLINISPIGRNCSHEERAIYEKHDLANNVRVDMVKALEKEFPDYNMRYSIGGQISFDVFPVGWDKTYCLQHVAKEGFEEIHFFGDKTFEGGNDYEIYHHELTTGHAVKSPDDTLRIINGLFF